jgi:3-methyladenine DNA glycosylase AlkD
MATTDNALLLETLRKQLNDMANTDTAAGTQRFFKEAVRAYGIPMAAVRDLAKEYAPRLKGMEKSTEFALCEELLRSAMLEEAHIATFWIYSIRKQYTEEDLDTFGRWLDSYIDSWAVCDNFCNNVMGAFLTKFPAQVGILQKWARSTNRWMRRAASVSLIVPARKGAFLAESFAIAETVLRDEEDLVLKGYGWLLKEQCKEHEDAVFEFVIRHKARMPRTALNYATEKMATERRWEAMMK